MTKPIDTMEDVYKGIVSRAVHLAVHIAVSNRNLMRIRHDRGRHEGLMVPFRVVFFEPFTRPSALSPRTVNWVLDLLLRRTGKIDSHDRQAVFETWTRTVRGYEPQAFTDGPPWMPNGFWTTQWYGMSAVLRDTLLPGLMEQARTELSVSKRSRPLVLEFAPLVYPERNETLPGERVWLTRGNRAPKGQQRAVLQVERQSR
jgi:hypothetical protein